MCTKNLKMSEIYMILPEKYFPDFFGVGGKCPLPPVSYAYAGTFPTDRTKTANVK